MNNDLMVVRKSALAKQEKAFTLVVYGLVFMGSWAVSSFKPIGLLVAVIFGVFPAAAVFAVLRRARLAPVKGARLSLELIAGTGAKSRVVERTEFLATSGGLASVFAAGAEWVATEAERYKVLGDHVVDAAALAKPFAATGGNAPPSHAVFPLDGGELVVHLSHVSGELEEVGPRPAPRSKEEQAAIDAALAAALAVKKADGRFTVRIRVTRDGDVRHNAATKFDDRDALMVGIKVLLGELRRRYYLPAQRPVVDALAQRWQIIAQPPALTDDEAEGPDATSPWRVSFGEEQFRLELELHWRSATKK